MLLVLQEVLYYMGSLFPKIETEDASFSKLGSEDLTLAIRFVEAFQVDAI